MLLFGELSRTVRNRLRHACFLVINAPAIARKTLFLATGVQIYQLEREEGNTALPSLRTALFLVLPTHTSQALVRRERSTSAPLPLSLRPA